jgi:hypothetical protein
LYDEKYQIVLISNKPSYKPGDNLKIIFALLDANSRPLLKSRKGLVEVLDPDDESKFNEEIQSNNGLFELSTELTEKIGQWKLKVNIEGKSMKILKFHVENVKLVPFNAYIEPEKNEYQFDEKFTASIFAQYPELNTLVNGTAFLSYLIYDTDSSSINSVKDRIRFTPFPMNQRLLFEKKISEFQIPDNLERAFIKLKLEVEDSKSGKIEETETSFLVHVKSFKIVDLCRKKFFVQGQLYNFKAQILNQNEHEIPKDQLITFEVKEKEFLCSKIEDSEKHKLIEYTLNAPLIEGIVQFGFYPTTTARKIQITLNYKGIHKDFTIFASTGGMDDLDTKLLTTFPAFGKSLSFHVNSMKSIKNLGSSLFNTDGSISTSKYSVEDKQFGFHMESKNQIQPNDVLLFENSDEDGLRYGVVPINYKQNKTINSFKENVEIIIEEGSFKNLETIKFQVKATKNSHVIIIASNENLNKLEDKFKKDVFKNENKRIFNPLLYGSNLFLLSNDDRLNKLNCKQENYMEEFDLETFQQKHRNQENIGYDSLIFEKIQIPSNGIYEYTMTAPDRFVIYNLRAIALHPIEGMSFSKIKQIKIFKPFAVKIQEPLPRKIYEHEIIEVIVKLYSFEKSFDENSEIKISLDNSNEFDIIESENGKNLFCNYWSTDKVFKTVRKNDMESSVTFLLRPKKTGKVQIKVIAGFSMENDRDSKEIEVFPRDIPYSENYSHSLRSLESKEFSFNKKHQFIVESSCLDCKKNEIDFTFQTSSQKITLTKSKLVHGFTHSRSDSVDLEARGKGTFRTLVYPKYFADIDSNIEVKANELSVAREKHYYDYLTLNFKFKLSKTTRPTEAVEVVIKLPGNYKFLDMNDREKSDLKRMFGKYYKDMVNIRVKQFIKTKYKFKNFRTFNKIIWKLD